MLCAKQKSWGAERQPGRVGSNSVSGEIQDRSPSLSQRYHHPPTAWASVSIPLLLSFSHDLPFLFPFNSDAFS